MSRENVEAVRHSNASFNRRERGVRAPPGYTDKDSALKAVGLEWTVSEESLPRHPGVDSGALRAYVDLVRARLWPARAGGLVAERNGGLPWPPT